MLILAGVSINAIVGDNGIITMAQKAKELSQKATELEDLQMALVGYSASSYSNQAEALDTIVTGLFERKYIDWIDGTKDDAGNYIDYNQYEDENGNNYMWVKKGENSYRIFLDEDETYSADTMPDSGVGGGTLKGGTYMVTKDEFSNGEGLSDDEKGKFIIEGDTKVIFRESLGTDSSGMSASGEMLCIKVNSGSKAKLYFNYDNNTKASDGKTYYFLTNEGLKRSAIDIESGGELDIIVGNNVVVNIDSGFGEEGETANGAGAKGGPGGYAGIHVPENATLNLFGKGTIIASGGRAGDGGGAYSGDTGGGRRRWSWSRNRW